MNLITEDHDDREFLDLIERVVVKAASRFRPENVYLVHVDNWFGDRWLRFSGKMLGALGVRLEQLTIPPFHPNRIHSEQHYRRDDETGQYYDVVPGVQLHRYQPSERNLHRRVSRWTDSGMFAWYSGNTLKNQAGSLMVYHVSSGDAEAWHARFEKHDRWVVKKCVGITPELLEDLAQSEYNDGK